MDFDVLIIGGGAAGMSCALILGSGLSKTFAKDKKVGILLHQRASHLETALLNNALGIKPGTPGKEILVSGVQQLQELYPQVIQLPKEKLSELQFTDHGFLLKTNKNTYTAAKVVLAVGYSDLIRIKGVEEFIIPHQKAKASKNRIQLKNEDQLVSPNLHVAGTLAGHRSQFAIAIGSGAAVATDILTDWNQGEPTKVHDKLK